MIYNMMFRKKINDVPDAFTYKSNIFAKDL